MNNHSHTKSEWVKISSTDRNFTQIFWELLKKPLCLKLKFSLFVNEHSEKGSLFCKRHFIKIIIHSSERNFCKGKLLNCELQGCDLEKLLKNDQKEIKEWNCLSDYRYPTYFFEIENFASNCYYSFSLIHSFQQRRKMSKTFPFIVWIKNPSQSLQ